MGGCVGAGVCGVGAGDVLDLVQVMEVLIISRLISRESENDDALNPRINSRLSLSVIHAVTFQLFEFLCPASGVRIQDP